uniref:Uncharacterized protein n=1 Tax=Oryza sativa subsp. japonica TaxID=39947 RepID=A0A411DB63_ORYSJ|nr:hypothetical protein [Oryza sativa Japonica Group]
MASTGVEITNTTTSLPPPKSSLAHSISSPTASARNQALSFGSLDFFATNSGVLKLASWELTQSTTTPPAPLGISNFVASSAKAFQVGNLDTSRPITSKPPRCPGHHGRSASPSSTAVGAQIPLEQHDSRKALLDNMPIPGDPAVKTTIAQVKAMVDAAAVQHTEVPLTASTAGDSSGKRPSRPQNTGSRRVEASQAERSHPSLRTSDLRDKIEVGRRLNADLRNVMNKRRQLRDA